jgi:hypothetical protein
MAIFKMLKAYLNTWVIEIRISLAKDRTSIATSRETLKFNLPKAGCGTDTDPAISSSSVKMHSLSGIRFVFMMIRNGESLALNSLLDIAAWGERRADVFYTSRTTIGL